MNRLVFRPAATIVLAVSVVCGCQQRPEPVEEQRPAPSPPKVNPALPPAPPPRPKVAALIVRSVKPAGDTATATRTFVANYGLTSRDLERIRTLPGVAELVPACVIPTEVRYLDRVVNVRVVATTAGYAAPNTLKPSSGRFLTDDDDTNTNGVCVLGSETASQLFPTEDPLGKSVTVRGHSFSVVGVLAEKPVAEHAVYIPLRTSRARLGEIVTRKGKDLEKVELHEIVVRPTDPDKTTVVADSIREVLEKSHAAKDWEVTVR